MEEKYLTRSRDVDTYLLERLEDKELLEVMHLNKDFKKLGSSFFEKRLKEKYPLLIKYKPKNMSFTKYYLSVVYYISKLKEEYDLDYVQAPSLNPKTYYYRLEENYGDTTNEYYYYIGQTGDIKLIKAYEDLNDSSLFSGAIASGNLDVVKYLENYGYFIDNPGKIIDAIISKNPEMKDYVYSKLLEQFEEDEINIEMVYGAAELGDLKLVKFYETFVDPNTHYQQILRNIDNIDVFKHFLEKIRNEILNQEINNDELIQELDDGAFNTVLNNNLDIIIFLIKEYPNLLDTIKDYAQTFHNDDVLELLK